jgi:hypothetical protein
MLKMLRNKRAQSTVEYVILVAIVIAVILSFSTTVFKPAFNTTLQQGTNGMQDMANRLRTSRP